ETNLPSIEKVKDLVFKLEAQFPEMNTLMDKALDDATRAEDVVKVAQKELPVVESVINDGQEALGNLDKFFANNDETLKNAPGTMRNNLTVAKDVMDKANAFTNFLMNPGIDLSGMKGLPEFPARPDLSKMNDEGYKNIARNINQTVNNVLNSARAGTAYGKSVVNGLQNGQFDPEKAKQDLNAVSENLQGRTDSIAYLINVFTELQKSATTDFGQSFFQGRVDRLTKLKSGMENANKGIKDIVNVIGTGQEVKKDVTDVANQKLDAANGLIDQAEKDYNETFVADYKKAVSTVDQAKADANEAYDSVKNEYEKAKNNLEGVIADVNNRGVNGLDSTKVALNDLNGQLQATNNLIGDAIPVLESTNKVLADVNSGKNLNGGIAKLNKIQNSVQKGIDATNKATTLINNGQKPTKEVVESINEATKNASAQLGDFLATYDSEIVPNFNTAIERTKRMSK
ncbi:phage infection protein, partial [Bacillus cereus]